MKVLLLSRYDRLGASSRLRTLQFLPALQAAGITVTVNALLPNAYLQDLYQGTKDYRYAVRGYLSRASALKRSREFDLLWIEKELLPWLPFSLESRWLDGPPVAVDLDDAIFHNYDEHPNRLVRSLLGRKIDQLMKRAALVTVGSRYLAQRAVQAQAGNVQLLPTVVDLDRYRPKTASAASSCVIGWIGTPKTAEYLRLVGKVLTQISRTAKARVVLIGSGPISLFRVPTEIHSWFEDTEPEKLRLFDIGIMPLPDESWERGKCGYKLIQYMAAGVPVVASPVGANVDIVDQGVNGFLARTEEEWSHYLSLLAGDPELRQRMGAAGRRKVEERYCTRAVAPRLKDLLLSAAGRGAPKCAA